MQVLKSIFVLFASLLVLMGTNGFILEKYFCNGCQKEKQEVQFFEFGEIHHNHKHCENCHDSNHECCCHFEDHINNSEVSYIALDLLFSNTEVPNINKTIVFNLNKTIFNSHTSVLDLQHFYNLDIYKIKIPPHLHTDFESTVKCALLSNFRL